ncbi:hypothetical protein N4738_26375, partial [Escherichia coli]|nr:hypothetical protein [Escherichia coli]
TDSEEPVQEAPKKRLSISEKAISLGSLRCKKAEEVERKQNRIYYRKPIKRSYFSRNIKH